MNRHHVLVGGLILVLCTLLASKDRWFLENTKKGQRLVQWFGPDSAIWVLRGIIAAAMVFGALLATGIVQPIRW